MKTPKFLSKLSAVLTPRPKKRLQAATRTARRPMESYEEDEEPTTKLSSAFIVVLILHVVAVGGIYAFNSIKASRKEREAVTAPAAKPTATAAAKVAQNGTAAKPAAPPAATTAPAAHPAAPASRVAEATPAPLPLPLAPAGKTYTVKGGDNLTKIAFAYSTTPAEIMEANHLKNGALLRPGQTLVMPAAHATKTAARPSATAVAETHKADGSTKHADVPPTSTTPGFYTVKKGDTPTSIAKNFGLTTEELLKANRITDAKTLQVGQTLKVPPRKS
jgi:LysM repeat protein